MPSSYNKANVVDVTGWIEKQYINTGGTREKSILESPGGDNYFFKTSLNKPGKDYKFEFWSEIIASKLGSILNLDLLQYDIAIKGDKIGCISKSMINQEIERLTEGVNYLVGYDNAYDPTSKHHQGFYSYQYINDALKAFSLERFIENIDEIIVFDALIGNSDRHQENWAIISEYTIMSKNLNIDIEEPVRSIKRGLKKIMNLLVGGHRYIASQDTMPKIANKTNAILVQSFLDNNIRFAPIYDSGSSLGREHMDEKLIQILKDKVQFDAYINRGKSEIHWHGDKLKHWELVSEVLKVSTKAKDTIEEIRKHFDEDIIKTMIHEIDNDVPEKFKDYKLTDIRKEFLTKLITLRYKKLIAL